MLHSAKKRICPSRICAICKNVMRHSEGVTKGMKPSNTSTKAQASQRLSLQSMTGSAPLTTCAALLGQSLHCRHCAWL